MALYPTRFIDDSDLASRKIDVPNADFDGGGNQAGACAPGVGINADDTAPIAVVGTPEQFTLEDQDEAARTPQVSQHIGGTGFVLFSGTYPSSGGNSGKGTEGIGAVTNDTSGNGQVTQNGDATLAALSGWTAV